MSLTFGGCHQHYTTASQGVYIYENTTRLIGYAPYDTTPVPPYERPDYPTYPSCETGYGYDCGDGVNGEYWCGMADPADVSCAAGSTTTVTQGLFFNCFTKTAVTMSDNTCDPKYGFKNVAAKKQWHGLQRKNSRDYNVSDYIHASGSSCQWHANDPNPETVHYLSQTFTGDYVAEGDNNFTAHWDQSVSVDRYSGKRTLTCASSSTVDYEAYIDIAQAAALLCAEDVIYLEELVYGASGYYTVKAGLSGDPTAITQNGPNGWIFEWYDPDYPTVLKYKITFDLDTHVSIEDYSGFNAGVGDTFQTYSLNTYDYTVSATTFSYTHVNEFHEYGTVTQTATTTGTAILSTPYTSTQLYSDIVNLLDKIDLTDDSNYPWRTDENKNFAPLVTYNEVWASPTNGNCDEPVDATVSTDILGQFMPLGYDTYWNFKHKNYREATYPCTGWYIHGYGASTPDYLPKGCTQWTNDYDGVAGVDSMFDRAFLYYDGATLHARKWAETFLPRPSFNYARPCGFDKFAYSSQSMYCVSGEAAGVLTIDSTSGPIELVTGDYAMVYGTGTQNGIWAITKNTDYEVGLTTLIISGSQIPSTILQTSANGPWIHRMRYTTIAPICGREEVVRVDNQTPLTCSFGSELYLTDGDNIQIRDERFATNTNGVWSVTRIDSASYALRGSVSASAANAWTHNPTNRSYAYSMYGAHYRWNDANPKQQYSVKEWHYNLRDYQEVDRLIAQYDWIIGLYTVFGLTCPYNPTPPAVLRYNQTLWGMPQAVTNFTCTTQTYTWNACRPTAHYITPNGDYVGHVKTFPATFTADDKYFAMWQAGMEQWVADYLWIAPPCPCSPDINDDYSCNTNWEEDPGQCIADTETTRYYPQRPYVEATCEPPHGAPTVLGAYVGCLPYAALNTPNQPAGNVCAAPSNLMPWAIYDRELTCVCANGRWATEYSVNGTECAYDGEEPI